MLFAVNEIPFEFIPTRQYLNAMTLFFALPIGCNFPSAVEQLSSFVVVQDVVLGINAQEHAIAIFSHVDDSMFINFAAKTGEYMFSNLNQLFGSAISSWKC